MSKDDIIGGQVADNKECNIFSDLLRIITNCNGQCDCAGGRGVVDQDSVCVVISYPYANDECIIMQVVEMSSIFF